MCLFVLYFEPRLVRIVFVTESMKCAESSCWSNMTHRDHMNKVDRDTIYHNIFFLFFVLFFILFYFIIIIFFETMKILKNGFRAMAATG